MDNSISNEQIANSNDTQTRQMKDSGVEWIGKVPCDWSIVRFKDYYKNKKEIAGEHSAEYERLALTLNGVIKRPKDDSEGLQPKEFDTYQILRENDFVFKMIDLQNISTSRVGLSPYTGLVSPAYIRFTSRTENQFNRFTYYYLMSMYYNCVFNSLGGDGVRSALNASDMGTLMIPFPDISEQQTIAAYLDRKCTQIDTLIANQQQQIEKLKAYKQSVITETVTKGLDPDVAMKDSGVEWIGKIPEHWELIPFRYVLKERNEKNIPIRSKERLSLSIELGVTLYSEKTTNLDRFKDDFEQYKLAHQGDLVMNSMNMIVGASGVSDYFGCVSPAYYIFYDDAVDHATAKYCEYIFRSKTMLRVLHSLGKGIYAIERGDDRINTCRLKVSKIDLKDLIVPFPPILEQRNIVNFISKKCSRIDELIAIKQQKIEKLQQYKKSLIYEYVTGKKEVI